MSWFSSVREGRRREAARLGCTSAQTRHISLHPRFVDEDELFGIEIQLPFKPVFSPLSDVGAILLAGVRGLFLNVRPQRSRKAHRVERDTFTPRTASRRSNNSLIVRSGVLSIRANKNSRWGSSLQRFVPPCLRAVRSPASRARRTQTIAVATPIPKWSGRTASRLARKRGVYNAITQILAVGPSHGAPPSHPCAETRT